jgi:predicted N-acetyltransferase YhbS
MSRNSYLTGVRVRRLEQADIEAADRILREAFGTERSYAPGLRRYLRAQPDGYRIALEGKTPLGVVGAIDYGPFAYIGSMAVLPTAQGRGLGRYLLEGLLAWLVERGTTTWLLDATAAGAPLYRRLGFEVVDGVEVYQQQAPVARHLSRESVQRFENVDLTTVASFDQGFFAGNREHIFQALLNDLNGRAFLTREASGEVSGYVFAQEDRIGPWAATSPESAEALLAAAARATASKRATVSSICAGGMGRTFPNGATCMDRPVSRSAEHTPLQAVENPPKSLG